MSPFLRDSSLLLRTAQTPSSLPCTGHIDVPPALRNTSILLLHDRSDTVIPVDGGWGEWERRRRALEAACGRGGRRVESANSRSNVPPACVLCLWCREVLPTQRGGVGEVASQG